MVCREGIQHYTFLHYKTCPGSHLARSCPHQKSDLSFEADLAVSDYVLGDPDYHENGHFASYRKPYRK